MKTFFIFMGILIACVSAEFDFGYTEDSPADKIKDNPGKCFVPNIGLIEKGAKIKVPGKCQQIVCLDAGKYRVKQCPPLAVEPPCYAVYPDKPFDDCCTFDIKCLEQHYPTPTRN